MSITVRTDLEQGTPEWLDARRGMVTASIVGQLVSIESADPLSVFCPVCSAPEFEPCLSTARKTPTPIKTPHSLRAAIAAEKPPVYKPATTDTAKGLTALLVAERITGWSDPTFVSQDMWRGKLDEPLARELYSKTYAPVTEAGIIIRDDWGFKLGYSPDGLVGEDGLLEIKSRRSKKQLVTILDGEVPPENMAQIQAGLLASGRRWCDFLSFCGGMPVFVKRVYPDAAWQAGIIEAVRLFEMNAARMIARYEQAVEGLPIPERTEWGDIHV